MSICYALDLVGACEGFNQYAMLVTCMYQYQFNHELTVVQRNIGGLRRANKDLKAQGQ